MAKKGKLTKCEIFSRVVGYYRPISQWNDGKQQEFIKRFKDDFQKYDKIKKGNINT